MLVNQNNLESSIEHILNNANRYRNDGSPIEVRLEVHDQHVILIIRNYGKTIDEKMLESIFEYGVTDAVEVKDGEVSLQRGQGLFVTRTYLSKMGAEIVARNTGDGVEFVIKLQAIK